MGGREGVIALDDRLATPADDRHCKLPPIFDREPLRCRDALVIAFDGECSFCSGWVSFVADRDQTGRFFFATVQSAIGRNALAAAGLPDDQISTVLLMSRSAILARSDAAIAILTGLGGMWKAVGLFRLVPRAIRDGAYDFVARNRYRIAGRKTVCALPRGIDPSRFIH